MRVSLSVSFFFLLMFAVVTAVATGLFFFFSQMRSKCALLSLVAHSVFFFLPLPLFFLAGLRICFPIIVVRYFILQTHIRRCVVATGGIRLW